MVDVLFVILLLFIFACYGSFLNSFAYRLINDKNLWTSRSYCPQCYKTISFYDLIPIISWLILKAKCRHCKNKISILYPFIEILSAFVFTALILFIDPQYWFSYFIFFSSLLIIIRTDFEVMLISSATTLLPIPAAFILAYFGSLQIKIINSLFGALFGYFVLFIIVKIYALLTRQKRELMGSGDFDLLALIGSFTGILGIITSVFLGSILAIIYFIIILLKDYLLNKTKLINIREYKVPFGPWLSIGAILYLFFDKFFLSFFELI